MHITCAPGISVVAPDTPDTLGTLRHDKIMFLLIFQANGCGETANTGTDDDYLERATVQALIVVHAAPIVVFQGPRSVWSLSQIC